MAEENETESTGSETIPLTKLAAEKAGALDTGDSVKTAGERMRAHDTGVWPVTKDRTLVGVVDEKNPDWQIGGRGHDPKDWSVGQIMSRDFVFCYEDQDCVEARNLMDERGLDYLPVVDRQMRIVGVFSREEVAAAARAEAPPPHKADE